MIDDMALRDTLESILRARHRRACWHETSSQSGGVCARCDADAIVDSLELREFMQRLASTMVKG